MQGRQNAPPPLLTGNGWKTSATPAGKPLVTPTNAVFAGQYKPPTATLSKTVHDHSAERSRFTNALLPYTARWPMLHSVMTEKDSRRIFYFMSLNFSFMAVQAFYGYVTDSLGLLSDSIHMFFDCVALGVGLFASVASKWPPNARFPYGFGKVETLSGFANGVFLVLISVEIMIEAFERIIEGRETKRLAELFIVSSLGLIVNLVGMAAFGHHHHGHDQGHHGHSHDNENMHGIYLHVLADTLGSGAVIVSTALTHFFPWAGWDPVASFLIAALILGSAVPLIRSSASRLLLTIPDQVEYSLRDILSGITELRGVAGYGVPKFWIDDRVSDDNSPGDKLIGSMHVLVVRGADMEDVRMRVQQYFSERNIDITLQVEREGDPNCWCGMGKSPLSPLSATSAMPSTPILSQRLKGR
ncbi:hypothetical protein M406DRAFT_89586 [Cryphonectria parasitica EP155]|uniref:Zinc transporter n=1 Tax=Cryphonectria parasitica (strain ATCC 38755 / EP155) TaxID=660469 RepID=A0A9P4Y5Q3_CRYP1|nr:uncharacterized protein M406DRAFT_89586 [Cryphonectria parasitica EP155]KAF3766990.1 hypothetical protein M406DRAFT_89586 [Cryphonectria parasitica EP155]